MTFEQEALQHFQDIALPKYLKGKEEHGQGLDVLDLPRVVQELEGEIIDMWFYYYAIKKLVEKNTKTTI